MRSKPKTKKLVKVEPLQVRKGSTFTKNKDKTLKDILRENKDAKNVCVVILDELTDTHNVGAIARSAVASGAIALVVSKNNQAPINDTVIKTSAGTAEMIDIVPMNVNEAIRLLKKEGFWIYGLFMQGETNLWKTDLSGKVAIVVGNEATGIHEMTKKLCDFALAVPMDKKVESLNASVATAIALYERLRQISA